MDIKKCLEIGISVGIIEIEEAINNILMHANMIPNAEKEIAELKQQAELLNIKFCDNCGFAKKNNKCYMCEKMK